MAALLAPEKGGPTAPPASRLGGWLDSIRGSREAPAGKAKSVSYSDSGERSARDQWSSDGSVDDKLWNRDIAAAMGYGKKGRAGSAFQWWILILSGLLAIGSFIAWCILIFRARDSTQAAFDAMRIKISWWDVLKSILLATAVCFPIFTVAALGVSLWRALLARRLNIHAPDRRWMRSCRAFQVANVASSVLLYAMFLLMVASFAAHAVWAYTARAAHVGAYFAIRYVDPIWTGTAAVVNASQGLVNNFVGLTQQLGVPAAAPGGRRLVEWDPVAGGATFTRELAEADVAAMPQEVVAAGLAAARSLQQLPDIVQGLGGMLTGAANAINSVPLPTIDTSALADLPFLPQLLPNGSSNPLFTTLRSVTDAVQGQLLNRTGCPIYCVDLRDQAWIQDGCLCNLDRVKAAYPHLGAIYRDTTPAMLAVFLMMVASTWLLLHAASQWARTRSESKLLARIPHAARTSAGGDLAAASAQEHLPVTVLPEAVGMARV